MARASFNHYGATIMYDLEIPHAPIWQPYSKWPLWVAYADVDDYWTAGRREAMYKFYGQP